MSLTGKQAQALNAALLDAFRSRSALERMVFYGMGVRLDEVASGGSLTEIVFKLVGWAEAHGRVLDLITGARAANSTNHALSAFAASYYGDRTPVVPSTSTPTPQESTPVTDLSTRPIHAAHRRGVLLLARDALALASDADAEAALADLLLDDATYRELPRLGGKDLDVALPLVLATIKSALPAARIVPVRVGEFLAAARGITPTRRHCTTCERLDLQRDAGEWVVTTGEYCQRKVDGDRKCGGTLAEVTFDPDVRAWTDGRDYAPGTMHDDARLPITDTAIRQWLAAKGGEVHPLLDHGITATQGALDLPTLCAYLVAQRLCASPLAALNALAKPFDANLFHDAASATVLCRKALAARGATVATAETKGGGTTEVLVGAAGRKYGDPEMTPMRKTLCEIFPTEKTARQLVVDIRVGTTRIDFRGSAEEMWGEILAEVNKHACVDALLDRAVQEYPNNPTLRALRG